MRTESAFPQTAVSKVLTFLHVRLLVRTVEGGGGACPLHLPMAANQLLDGPDQPPKKPFFVLAAPSPAITSLPAGTGSSLRGRGVSKVTGHNSRSRGSAAEACPNVTLCWKPSVSKSSCSIKELRKLARAFAFRQCFVKRGHVLVHSALKVSL